MRNKIFVGYRLEAKFLHIADLLVQFGPHNVGLPLIRFKEDKIWDRRLKGKDARCLYFLATYKQIVALSRKPKKHQGKPLIWRKNV